MAENDRVTGLVGNTGVKAPVRVATTAAITLSGEQTIDGVAVVSGDRVLVKDQATGSANGIYVCDTGTWERSKDANGAYDWMQGTLVVVASGSTNGGAVFKQTTAGTIVPGTSALAFSSMGLLSTPVPVASGGTGGASAAAGLANLGVVQVTAEAGTNTITGTVDALVTAYRADQLFVLTPAVTNTGATTFNPTPSGGAALGAKNVYRNGGPCDGGELRAGVPALLQYDGTQFNILNPALSSLPAGAIYGLALSNGTDATNDINIAAGRARDSTNTLDLVLATAMGKQLDVAWAPGGTTSVPAGGRMSAAAIANGTYHVYLIRKDSDGTIDSGFDVSASAPTLPSGYSTYRRIGAIIRVAGAILAFNQFGDLFRLKTPVNVSYSPGSTAFTLLTAYAPNGPSMEANVTAKTAHGSTAGLYGYLQDGDAIRVAVSTDMFNFGSPYAPTATYVSPANSLKVLTQASTGSASILGGINTTSTAAGSLLLTHEGWTDFRNRFSST